MIQFAFWGSPEPHSFAADFTRSVSESAIRNEHVLTVMAVEKRKKINARVADINAGLERGLISQTARIPHKQQNE